MPTKTEINSNDNLIKLRINNVGPRNSKTAKIPNPSKL